MESCVKHPHERGVALCRRCGASWCADCLVYAFGPKKPPYCMGCAMFAGGVRSAATRPALSRKEMRTRRKEAKVAARSGDEPDSAAEEREPVEATTAAMAAPAPETTPTPASDWSTPWWESQDRQPSLAD